MDSQIQHETLEESRRTHWVKLCEYKDEDNSPNIVSGKNYQASSHKFRQTILYSCKFKNKIRVNYVLN